MRQLDRDGLEFCKYRGSVFEKSLKKIECSSPIFIHRFCKSDFAKKLDSGIITNFSLDIDEAFNSLNEQYGPSNYGKIKYNQEQLYRTGYMLRYISYTREVSTFYVYKRIPIKLFIESYRGYHTQSEEVAITHILDCLGLDESCFDPNEELRKLLRKQILGNI